MEKVEQTGLFTCLREKTWRALTEEEIERLAIKFVETVRAGCDEREDYGVAMRFLEDVEKRLCFWLACQGKVCGEEREGCFFFGCRQGLPAGGRGDPPKAD